MPVEFAHVNDPAPLPEVPDTPAQHSAWYVVHTKQHKERAVQGYLQQNGLPTYLPLLCQWPRPPVGSEVAPMFPCYLFVRAAMPHDFYRVRFSPGVHGFVANPAGPASLDDCVVSFLQSREGSDGIIRLDPLPAGRPVRIVSGPFKGFVAVVEQRLTARHRVRVLLDLLQRQTRVELPEKWVRQA